MPTIEERVEQLEMKVAQLIEAKSANGKPYGSDWEQIVGSFADSEGFEEAVRLGREYRESLRPKDNSDLMVILEPDHMSQALGGARWQPEHWSNAFRSSKTR